MIEPPGSRATEPESSAVNNSVLRLLRLQEVRTNLWRAAVVDGFDADAIRRSRHASDLYGRKLTAELCGLTYRS